MLGGRALRDALIIHYSLFIIHSKNGKQQKKHPFRGVYIIGFYVYPQRGGYWFDSGDDLLFRGLSQSTIGDAPFPCLVRDGTEGG